MNRTGHDLGNQLMLHSGGQGMHPSELRRMRPDLPKRFAFPGAIEDDVSGRRFPHKDGRIVSNDDVYAVGKG